MVFGKSKWVIFNFLPYEYESLEEYLEKMASKGWFLKYINGYYLKFVRSNPKVLKYSVDIMDSISFLEGKNSKRALEYREYCKEAGWDFVCESEKIQIYCSEEKTERIDIHTDEAEKFNIIKKASFKYIILKFITFILLLYPQYAITIGSNDGEFLASLLSLGILAFILLLSIHEIINIITFLRFITKGKKDLNKGQKISYNLKSIVLTKKIITISSLSISFITLAILSVQSDLDFLKISIILATLAIIFNYIVDVINSKHYQNKKMIIPSIFLFLSLAIFIIVISIGIKNIFIKNYKYNEEMLEKTSHLTLEDFNDTSKDDKLYCRVEKSPIASHIYYSDTGEKDILSYGIFESKYEWAVRYNFNKEMNFAKKADVSYIEKQTNLPDKDIKVYMNEHGHMYLIISPIKMVEIFTIEGVSEEELINTVYEQVFK